MEFLAHGGAGGAPVFMGVGYVGSTEGMDGEGEDDDEYQPNKRSGKFATIRERRRGKR
jgi:hypothetical protein